MCLFNIAHFCTTDLPPASHSFALSVPSCDRDDSITRRAALSISSDERPTCQLLPVKSAHLRTPALVRKRPRLSLRCHNEIAGRCKTLRFDNAQNDTWSIEPQSTWGIAA
jgi:hypothetical protein